MSNIAIPSFELFSNAHLDDVPVNFEHESIHMDHTGTWHKSTTPQGVLTISNQFSLDIYKNGNEQELLELYHRLSYESSKAPK